MPSVTFFVVAPASAGADALAEADDSDEADGLAEADEEEPGESLLFLLPQAVTTQARSKMNVINKLDLR